MKTIWRTWKYALGSFSDNKTAKYDDAVCILRSFIFITYFTTNCFITAGVIRHWNSMSKIDTQGMSLPADPNYKGKMQEHKPMMVKPDRLLTPMLVKELKILINEVLDEREYKAKLEGAYDDPEPPPQSYFDLEGREYPVE